MRVDAGEPDAQKQAPFKVTEPFWKGIHQLKMPIGGAWEDDVVVDDDGRVLEGEERARHLQKRRAQGRERTEGLVVSASACFIGTTKRSRGHPALRLFFASELSRFDPHHP